MGIAQTISWLNSTRDLHQFSIRSICQNSPLFNLSVLCLERDLRHDDVPASVVGDQFKYQARQREISLWHILWVRRDRIAGWLATPWVFCGSLWFGKPHFLGLAGRFAP